MTNDTLTQTEYFTVAEVAARLRLSKMTVYRMCDSGTIASIRIGGRTIRIPAASFEAHLAGLEGRRPAPVPVIAGQIIITPDRTTTA